MRFLYRAKKIETKKSHVRQRQMRRWQWGVAIASLSLCLSLTPSMLPKWVANGKVDGWSKPVLAQESLQQQENQVIRQYALPKPAATPPVYRPQPRRAAPRPAPRPAPRSAPAPRPAPAPTPSPAPAPAPSPTPDPTPEAVDAAADTSDSDPCGNNPARDYPRTGGEPVCNGV